jgi:V-type H+-transporting ATPase subunit a
MSLVQLYIPTEVAHDTISELGEMGNFQFKDVRQTGDLSTDGELTPLS